MSEEIVQERRQYHRFPVQGDVEVVHPGYGTLRLVTRDMHQQGAFLQLENDAGPSVGTVVFLRLESMCDLQRPDIIKARVVREVPSGIAVQFEG